ncbi:hypothetical protein LIER_00137 [Lithospermum erythrorhizon]|uniref:Uncharacterized protein n=1 Tax=Lithospermum erythrorhizon TaxID=34254 RepID=A0AAV3NGC9_LITER
MPAFDMQVLTSSSTSRYIHSQTETNVTITYSTEDEEDFGVIDSVIKKFISNTENKRRIIGFDTWRRNSGSCDNPIRGIALSDGKTCLICQLWSFKAIPTSLSNFLSLSSFTFVSSGVKFSRKKLEADYGLGIRNVVEMGQYTPVNIRTPVRVESLVSERWDVHILNADQITYITWNACYYFLSLSQKYSGMT